MALNGLSTGFPAQLCVKAPLRRLARSPTESEQIKGASSKDVVDLLLITQYFDMLNAIGTRPDTQTVFIDEDGE